MHWKPFENDKDDNLAIVTQISIFFTLLSALLTKVQVDKTDGYNQLFFGILLICLQSSGIVMVIGMSLAEKIITFGQLIFATNHSHDGSLRGMNVAETTEKKGFIEHFIQVSISDEKEGGWKNFYEPVKLWTEFFNYSNAEIAFRNSKGNGPIDEYRVKFQTQAPINIVMDYALNKNREKRENDKESYVCGGDNNSNYKQYYVAEGMRGLFNDRDMLIEEYSGRMEFEGKPYGFIARRSISNEEIYSLKKTSTMKRVKANVIIAGYLFEEEQGGKGADLTSVTYLENIDLGGAFKGLLMNSIVPSKLRMKVDDILAFVEEENGENGGVLDLSDSVSDIRGGGGVEMSVMGNKNQKQYPRELRAVSGGEIGLGFGDTLSKHEKYKKQALEAEELRNPVLSNIGSHKTVMKPARAKASSATAAPTTSLPSHISKFASGDFRAAGIRGGGGRKQSDNRTKAETIEKGDDIREVAETEEEGGRKKNGGSRWSSIYDEIQESYYYVDYLTNETTWERPDDFED